MSHNIILLPNKPLSKLVTGQGSSAAPVLEAPSTVQLVESTASGHGATLFETSNDLLSYNNIIYNPTV